MADTRIYRVTLERDKPQWYQSRISTRVVAKRALTATIAAWKDYSHTRVVRVERSQPIEWEDVTSAFIPHDE